MDVNKDTYAQFCRQTPELPIFFQDWYLDAVTQEGEWNAALVESGGKVLGVWPYFLKKKAGFQYITMPLFVKFMGPWLADNPSLTEQHQLLQALQEKLPKIAGIKQDCHYQFSNWLPLYWQGYQQTTKYSYRLDINHLDQVQKNINRNMRRNLLKASQQLEATLLNDPEQFFAINEMSFSRQGLVAPYSKAQFLKHDQALEQHRARQIFFGKDAQGRPHAAAYLIWDKQSSYYHLAGDDPALRQSGASIFLIWEAIRYTKEVLGLDTFDFEGSMLPKIEAIRRQFGAQQQPYFYIQKYYSRPYQLLEQIKTWIGK